MCWTDLAARTPVSYGNLNWSRYNYCDSANPETRFKLNVFAVSSEQYFNVLIFEFNNSS